MHIHRFYRSSWEEHGAMPEEVYLMKKDDRPTVRKCRCGLYKYIISKQKVK